MAKRNVPTPAGNRTPLKKSMCIHVLKFTHFENKEFRAELAKTILIMHRLLLPQA
jgi:hypothetical protein